MTTGGRVEPGPCGGVVLVEGPPPPQPAGTAASPTPSMAISGRIRPGTRRHPNGALRSAGVGACGLQGVVGERGAVVVGVTQGRGLAEDLTRAAQQRAAHPLA